jgi:hypothetical protein
VQHSGDCESWGVVLRRRTPWKELTTRQRQAIIIRGACQTALLAAALNDLGRRSRGEIRGLKAVWVAISAVTVTIWALGPSSLVARPQARRVGSDEGMTLAPMQHVAVGGGGAAEVDCRVHGMWWIITRR